MLSCIHFPSKKRVGHQYRQTTGSCNQIRIHLSWSRIAVSSGEAAVIEVSSALRARIRRLQPCLPLRKKVTTVKPSRWPEQGRHPVVSHSFDRSAHVRRPEVNDSFKVSPFLHRSADVLAVALGQSPLVRETPPQFARSARFWC
jgi:hypothetical protein